MTQEVPNTVPGIRIAFLNGKGGVAKTTSTVYTAEAAVRRGYTVHTYDADSQGSLCEWTSIAGQSGGEGPQWTAEPVTQFHLSKMAQTPVSDGVVEIIDCPPKDPQIMNLAVKAADFVVVPTQPSVIEMERVWKTLPNLGDTPAAVLIVGARLGTRLLEQTKTALDAESVPYFSTVIPMRESVRASGNTVPVNLQGYEDVLHEIEEVIR